MPRKKGWYKAKRNADLAEEQKLLHEFYLLPKKAKFDSMSHLIDHDYHTKEPAQTESILEDYSTNFTSHLHIHGQTEKKGSSAVIYDDTKVAETVEVTLDHFENMYQELNSYTTLVKSSYIVAKCSDSIKIIELYESAMKLCLIIKRNLTLQLYVHNRIVPKSNAVFDGITEGNITVVSLVKFLNRLKAARVCIGNTEHEFMKLLTEGSGLTIEGDGLIAYLEQDFGAKRKEGKYFSSIRSIDCEFILSTKSERCIHCSRTRSVLRNREFRMKEKEKRPVRKYIKSKASHSQMDKDQLLSKLNEQKKVIKDLEKEKTKLNKEIEKYIKLSLYLMDSDSAGSNGDNS